MSLISCTTRQIVLAQEYLIFTIEHYNLSNTPAEQWFFFNAVSFAIDCHQISHRTPESMHLILLFAKHKSWITVGYKTWLYSVFFYKPLTSNYKLKYVCMQIKKVKGAMMGEVGFPQLFFTLMDGSVIPRWMERTTDREREKRAQTQEENAWQNQGISTAGDQWWCLNCHSETF